MKKIGGEGERRGALMTPGVKEEALQGTITGGGGEGGGRRRNDKTRGELQDSPKPGSQAFQFLVCVAFPGGRISS